MNKILSVFFLLAALFSCSKTDDHKQDIQKVDTSHCIANTDTGCNGIICQSDTCQTYFAIWKNQFMLRNQMSTEYFNSNITPCMSRLYNWVDGISFEITFRVKIDWTEAVLTDKFAIWLSKTTLGLFPTLNAPRNTLLTEDQISSLFSLQAFSSVINSVSPVNQLKYSSLQEAMKALIKASNVDTLCPGNVFFQSPNLTSPPAGDPFIEASGVLNWNENRCITGSLDLVTGESDIFYNVCFINN